jgi:hypothetical protein
MPMEYGNARLSMWYWTMLAAMMFTSTGKAPSGRERRRWRKDGLDGVAPKAPLGPDFITACHAVNSLTSSMKRQQMLETWDANRFVKVMAGGRTHPLLLGCFRQASEGTFERREMVVKALGLPEVTEESMFREILGNLVARALGIHTPTPGIVQISPEFVPMIHDGCSAEGVPCEVKPGPAAGTEFISPGLSNVIPVKSLTAKQIEDAARIYAFDLLVQNPDRRGEKPNFATHKGGLVAFDFEMAFSFLLAITSAGQPWEVTEHNCYKPDDPHVFRGALRGRVLDWTWLRESCRHVSREQIIAFCAAIPKIWSEKVGVERITDHLIPIMEHVDEFIEELERSLA